MSTLSKLAIGLMLSGLAAAPALAADPGVRVEHAAARVVVIPEARSDYAISISQGRAGMKPLTIHKDGGVTVVDGGYSWGRVGFFNWGFDGMNCHGINNNMRVSVPGRGDVAVADLPVVTIRAPLDARIGASGAVYGEVGASHSLDLSNSGCGDWRVANVQGPLHIAMSGSGDVHAQNGGEASISISGSSDVFLGAINGRLETRTSGSGDIHAASARGGIETRIAGSGDVTVDGGDAASVGVSIMGSGDFRFKGTAGSVDARIAGSGDVDIARATGPVSKHIAGSGDVNIGR